MFIRGVMLDALTQKPRNDVRFGPQAAVKILGPVIFCRVTNVVGR